MSQETKRAVSLDDRQIKALQLISKIGRQLQLEHTNLIEMYAKSRALELTRKLEIARTYGISEEIALCAIRKALKGHDGQLGVDAYPALADDKTLDEIGRQHMIHAGKVSASLLLMERRGIHAMSDEQKSEAGRRAAAATKLLGKGIIAMTATELSDAGKKGGPIGGKISYQRKLGIFGLTKEQRTKASQNANLALGRTLWIEATSEKISEMDFALAAPNIPENQYKKGPWVGRPNWKLITQRINSEYHKGNSVRTVRTVESTVNSFLRKQKNTTT